MMISFPTHLIFRYHLPLTRLNDSGGLRTNIPAQMATAGPPLGTQLGQLGVNIANFVKDFNLRTSIYRYSTLSISEIFRCTVLINS
jgi:hypothetical protein